MNWLDTVDKVYGLMVVLVGAIVWVAKQHFDIRDLLVRVAELEADRRELRDIRERLVRIETLLEQNLKERH